MQGSVVAAEIFDPLSGRWVPEADTLGRWTSVGDMVFPRMAHSATLLDSGQVLVVGQAGDPEAGIEPAGAVIEYDAEAVEVRMHRGGFAFDSSFGRDADDIRRILQDAERDPEDAVFSVGNHITLHSVAIRPHQHAIWVAHGRSPSAHYGGYAKYDLRELLKR